MVTRAGFQMAVKGNRFFTIEAQALDEHGQPSENKARVVLGLWMLSTILECLGDQRVQAMNSFYWETLSGDGHRWRAFALELLMNVAMAADYVYRGRVLYVDTVTPVMLVLLWYIDNSWMDSGAGNQVMVAGVPATVASLSPTRITAMVSSPIPGSCRGGRGGGGRASW